MGNEYVEQRIIKCRVAGHCDHGSDHHPVETILNLQPCPYRPEALQPYNYTKTNWKIFEQKLGNYLPILTHFTQPTVETANQLASDISAAIRQAITETTLWANICSFSKRWWNEELADLRKQAQRAQKRFNKHSSQENEEEWKEHRKTYQYKMDECKWSTWQKFISEADDRSIWKIK